MTSELKIEDTNVAKIGSDEDLKLRIAAAKTEEQWKGVGEKEELRVWRIEKFQVKPWPQEKYGSFYDGDSYIIFKSYKPDPNAEKLAYDIHFWLGLDSSLDEMGTAAYKTVELDDLLQTLPVQHREVQGNESELFLSYFPKGVHLLKGGIESGFKHVGPKEYKPKLLQIKGKSPIRVFEVPLSHNSLNQGDVFVLDKGLTIYQWSGDKSSRAERYTAMTVANALRSDRGGKPTINELDNSNDGSESEFWSTLGTDGSKPSIASAEEGGDDSSTSDSPNRLFQISDASGKMEFKQVEEGTLHLKSLLSDDVFLADVGKKIYIWVGKGASKKERSEAMFYAMNYLKQQQLSLDTQISRVVEGQEPSYFRRFFAEN